MNITCLSSSPDSIRPPDNFRKPKKVTPLGHPYDPSSLGLSVPIGSLHQVYEWCRQAMSGKTGATSVAESPRSPASTTGSRENELMAELEEQLFGSPRNLMITPKPPGSKSTPVRRGKNKTPPPPPFVGATAKGIRDLFRVNSNESNEAGPAGSGDVSSDAQSAAPSTHKAGMWLFITAVYLYTVYLYTDCILVYLYTCKVSQCRRVADSVPFMNHE